ncbi:response regulator transcription factor [Vallitalea pronyensis]|uniref:Stage 0 sporulation protein A homolog n=1 Tax=Vallitalea pronyensis TaxID=1348613 RepID=A0A8J8SGW9_9FIRM|nr:response regulator transcription factor [Vallitalea pronyensis]QUI22829.1 response regulator transcription factor [Vallitalea pronyensis]
MAQKILIVEDEAKIARFLELELKYEGYEVDIATNGREGLDKGLQPDVDLIVLDLMLPILSGIEVCRRIRQSSNVPIIMLTAKDDVSDKVMGLDMGADDYLTKPFAIEELLARTRVALKREVSKKVTESNTLSYKNLTLNKDQRQIMIDHEEVILTKKEFELLVYLLENRNIVLSRENILEKVWGFEYYGDTNIIDVYIRYLRGKIDQRFSINMIHTVRGVGYVIKDEK